MLSKGASLHPCNIHFYEAVRATYEACRDNKGYCINFNVPLQQRGSRRVGQHEKQLSSVSRRLALKNARTGSISAEVIVRIQVIMTVFERLVSFAFL